MKINKITFNSFKSQVNQDNLAQKNQSQTQNQIFNNTYDKMLYPQGIKYWIEIHKPTIDIFKNVQTSTLKNNVILKTDKDSPEDKIAIRMFIKPIEDKDVNPAVKLMHGEILRNLDDYGDENDNFATFFSGNGKVLEISINWDKKDFPKVFEKYMQYFRNLDFACNGITFQKQFEMIKENFLQDLNFLQEDKRFNRLYNVKKFSKEDVEKVSIDDIKKYHNDLLSNSMTLCALSCPKSTDEAAIKQIKEVIENQIPSQKTFDNKIILKNPLPIEKDEVFYLEPDDNIGRLISKTYNFQNENTLKDMAMFELIGTAVNKIIYKNHSQNFDKLFCSHYADYLNKYFDLCVMAGKSADINADMISFAINTITQKPLDDKFFEEVKQGVVKSLKEDSKNSTDRTSLLLCCNQNSISDGDFTAVLNSITPKELQQAAQKYFNSPCITKIS